MCSDGGAFGSYALCTDCWNLFARQGLLPPSSPGWLVEDIKAGVVILETVERGLVIALP